MSDRRLARNIAFMLVQQGANYLLPLITLPYMARVLTPTGFGSVAIAMAIAQYGSVIVDWGFNLTATQEVARCQHDSVAVSRIVWRTNAARGLLVFCLLLVLAPAALLPAVVPYRQVLLASWLVTLTGVLFPQYLFQGLERMGPITWINLASRLVTIPLVFLLIRSPADYVEAVYIQAAAGLVTGVLAWVCILRGGWVSWQRPRWPDVRQGLQASWTVFFSNAVVSLYTVSTTLLLGTVANTRVVGFYSAADRVRSAALSAWTPVAQAVFPRAAAMASQDREQALVFLRKLAVWCLLVNGAISLGMLVTAPWLVRLLFGHGYETAGPVLMIMAAQPLLIGLSNVLGHQIMLPFGMQRQFSRILLVSAIINVVLLLVLGSYFQAAGAAAAVTLTEVFVTVVMFLVLRRHGIVFWGRSRNEC